MFLAFLFAEICVQTLRLTIFLHNIFVLNETVYNWFSQKSVFPQVCFLVLWKVKDDIIQSSVLFWAAYREMKLLD